MTAPALVALAVGPLDARTARTVRDIASATKRMRPDLRIEAAFTAGAKPPLDRVVSSLAGRGYDEVVVVPLLVTSTEQTQLSVVAAIDQAGLVNPGVRISPGEVIGADAGLLGVLDVRMRTALRLARVRELDAVVLAATGTTDARVNAAIARLARLWSVHHHLPTSIAFADTSPPSTGEAVREWRRQGKRHVAVGSLFITAGPHADRATELALEAGACAVSAPLGEHEAVSRLIVARYAVGALELVPV